MATLVAVVMAELLLRIRMGMGNRGGNYGGRGFKQNSFYIKSSMLKVVLKVSKHLGNFCYKLWHQSPSKIAQSGHTGSIGMTMAKAAAATVATACCVKVAPMFFSSFYECVERNIHERNDVRFTIYLSTLVHPRPLFHFYQTIYCKK